MYNIKKDGEVTDLETKWSYSDNPNVKLTFKVKGLSEYQTLMIFKTFYNEVKDFLRSEA